MTKVAITDYTFPGLDTERAILEPLGAEVVAAQCKTPEALIELTHDADHVITQFAPVNADVIAAMEKAKVIVRYGIGVDNVDLEAAREKGIPVCNVPDFCINEVADHTLAFILATTRRVFENSQKVKSGEWGLAVPLEHMQALCDLTVGIVGFGRIGKAVAMRLAAFGCRMLVSDPVVEESVITEQAGEPTDLDTLLSESDIITLHCPSSAATQQMINRESIAKTKPGVILINVGRGTLVNSNDLVAALQSGHVAAAALDVFDPEPVPADSPLCSMDNVILASHVASASPRSRQTLQEAAANLAALSIQGKPLPTVVNGL